MDSFDKTMFIPLYCIVNIQIDTLFLLYKENYSQMPPFTKEKSRAFVIACTFKEILFTFIVLKLPPKYVRICTILNR
jgi:hypothetical protein